MKARKSVIITVAAICGAIAIGVGAYAVTTAGSSSDPLVTKSYVDKVLTPDIMDKAEENINEAAAKLKDSLDKAIDTIDIDGVTFKSVPLTSGQQIICSEGTEIMLRSGSAFASTDGLVDTTAASAVAKNGALTANHMCVATADGAAVTASGEVQLLVRGEYTLG